MTSKPVLREAGTQNEFAAARLLFEEYAEHLAIDLCFQDFESELDQLPDMYGPPSGCLLLACCDEAFVACGGVRRISDSVCEMKRLYVRPELRGMKVGRELCVALIRKASALGYTRLVLDTLAEMTAARCLYRSLGFREIPPYYLNPTPGVLYMETRLSKRIH
jgi:ribosomal protein S18 acetylase RimI-like enzyme